MKPGRLISGLLLLAATLWPLGTAHAEEILLKNGQKIVGTIVGYENDMFRVETEFGIALVRKDKVASIMVSKPEDAKSTPEPPKQEATKSSPTKPAATAAIPANPAHPSPLAASQPNAGSPQSSSIPSSQAENKSSSTTAPAPGAAAATPASAAKTETQPTESKIRPAAPVVQSPPPAPPLPPPVSHPVDVPLPAHLEEHVDGNTYFNDTFHFSMFKPPDWKIYEGVPKETGSGIMAMGTEDEQTLLIVDRQVWSGAPNLSSDEVEVKLRQTYQEYRRVSEEPFLCDGQAAVRRSFTGLLDGAEWHGVAVHVIQGNMVLGIIGLTSSETFQFQEAIFLKIMKTFHHLPASAPRKAAKP